MIQIEDKKDCCGCTACAAVCPKQCIEMESDNEGFCYPRVDTAKNVFTAVLVNEYVQSETRGKKYTYHKKPTLCNTKTNRFV